MATTTMRKLKRKVAPHRVHRVPGMSPMLLIPKIQKLNNITLEPITMHYLLYWLHLALFLCPVFADWQEEFYGTHVTVQRNGGIVVTNGNTTIKVRFREIIETDQNGDPVGESSLDNHHYKSFEKELFVSKPLEHFDIVGIDKNISGVRKNFVAGLDGPGAQMTLQLSVFDNNTMIPGANTTEYYTVFNGTVKFAFTIENWPFCGTRKCRNKNGRTEHGEYINVYVAIEGGRDMPVRANDRSRSESGSKPSTWDYGGGQVTFSHKYYSNNTWYEMGPGYPIITRRHNENVAVFRFRSFYSVFYDPVINLSAHPYVKSAADSRCLAQVMMWFVVLSVYVLFS